MAINCSLTSGKYKELLDEITTWSEKATTRSYFKDPYAAAIKLAESETMAKFKEIKHMPLTSGQLGSFKARLKELSRSVENGSLDSKFAQFFWQSSHLGKKDPIVGSILKNMQYSSFVFRNNELNDRNLAKDILTNIRDEAGSRGLGGKLGMLRADKDYARLDDMHRAAIAAYKNGEKGAHDKILTIQKQKDELVNDTYLKVADDMVNIIENDFPRLATEKYNKMTPKEKVKIDKGERRLKITEADIKNAILPDGKPLSPQMYKALTSYHELTENLYGTLRNAVNKRTDAIVMRLQLNGKKMEASEISKIKDKLNAKIMPNYEQGFFPHFTRDLNVHFMDGAMSHLENMNNSANAYGKKGKKPMKQIINEMNSYIDGHTKSRAKDLESGEFDYQYSRNLVGSLNNYIFDVNRFNFTSFMDAHYMDALTSVEQIYRKDGNAKGYAENIVNYITDLHQAANGNTNMSEGTRNVVRSILGFEFISKLGVNPRGAVRNFTQRLLDYVTWGPVQINKMNERMRTLGIGEKSIEQVLKDSGLLFEEASPQVLESALQGPASVFKTVSWNEQTGKFESHKKSRLEKFADGMGAIAGKSSILHRAAENSNRKNTFKLAYTQMYRWLDTPDYRQSREDKGRKGKQVTQDIQNAARRYAINMVVMNHFDYADYAKSKALRTTAGRFLGQFQHYSFEFFERNLKIMREAKHDVLAGKLLPNNDARGLQQAYRMGLLYFMAPVVASAITGVNFDNLIEHDTGTRLNQLAVALTGDDEEIRDAFYGKGPLLATFGGPLVSDVIDVGVMMDLVDLDDDSILSIFTGMEKYDPSTQSTDISKKLRLLNGFLGRTVERHIPQMSKGRIGWALQQELGLYPTKEARKVQKEAQDIRKKLLPADIEKALKALEQGKIS